MTVDVHGLDDKTLIHMEDDDLLNHVNEPLGQRDGQDVINKAGQVVMTTRNDEVLDPRTKERVAKVQGNLVISDVGTELAKVYGGTAQDKAVAAAGFMAFFTNL